MTADDVKDALRRRHPAASVGSMVGQWTCIEEWDQVDLLALNAWGQADVIGYEVKVSRSDYRQEILAPSKRVDAVSMCTEFYFAVPEGLLKPDEIAYAEPEWSEEDWHRARCPGVPRFGPVDSRTQRRHRPVDLLDTPPGRYGGPCVGKGRSGSYKAGRRERGPFTVRMPVPLARTDPPRYVTHTWSVEDQERRPLEGAALRDALIHWIDGYVFDAEMNVACPTCGGKGYLEKSRVEIEAPTLWVPRDVGLIEVTARGCRVARRAPKRMDAPGLISGSSRKRVAHLVRWTSNRPDPRHALPVGAMEMAA